MRFYQKFVYFLFIIFIVSFLQRAINVQALNYNIIQQPNSDYDDEIELEHGVPTLISEVSVPPGNIFGGQVIEGLYLKANFSYNNGSIWINNQINDTIWQDHFNGTIERYINTNSSSIRKYSLWANSSTLDNATLYYTFSPRIFHAENFGLGILLVLLPIIIIGMIIYTVTYGRKTQPHSVRVATRIVERMKLKYEAKHPEKLPKKEGKFCLKCGAKVQDPSDNFCMACGFRLKDYI